MGNSTRDLWRVRWPKGREGYEWCTISKCCWQDRCWGWVSIFIYPLAWYEVLHLDVHAHTVSKTIFIHLGCCWWGRGVIQTSGVCNFGKKFFKRPQLQYWNVRPTSSLWNSMCLCDINRKAQLFLRQTCSRWGKGIEIPQYWFLQVSNILFGNILNAFCSLWSQKNSPPHQLDIMSIQGSWGYLFKQGAPGAKVDW